MSLVMMGVRYRGDNRAKYIHHGNWLAKLGVWLLFCALPFILPNAVVDAYGEFQKLLVPCCLVTGPATPDGCPRYR